MVSDRRLFAVLWREEVRLHAKLFGGGRFLTFPLVIFALAIGGGLGLTLTGTGPDAVLTGVRTLTLAFGLYAGTAGLVGSDAMENLLGDVTLLLSTTETLPLSPRRLLGLFLLKDGCFYALAFLLPLAAGSVPLFVLDAGVAGVGELSAGVVSVALTEAARLWLQTTTLFALGMSVTVGLIALRTRRAPRWVLGLTLGGLALVAWRTGVVGAALGSPSVRTVVGSALLALVVSIGALAIYDSAYQPPARSATAQFRGLSARIPGDGNDIVARSLLELARSSGGFGKPLVSATLLLAVVGGLVGIVEAIVGVRPAPGVFFGSVLGLSAFTTYTWLTMFDEPESYLMLPLSATNVLAAKRRAFLIVGLPTSLAAYAVALVMFPTSLADAAAGATLVVGFSLYVFGVTTALAGFDPNEFLFDVVRFAAFSVAIAAVVVPLVIASFLPGPPLWVLGVAVSGGGALAVVGYGLSVWAGGHWERNLRE
ncbi:MAG: hypothetical protein ABEH81_16345 [Halopenitus sp.]